MKKLSLLLILCSFFAATSVFAQTWGGSSLNGNTYREGRVAIGYPSPGPIPTPQAKLDINLPNPAGASEGSDAYIPHIRLQQTLTGSTPTWDITGGLTLNFGYGTNGSSTNSVLSFNNSVLNYNGTQLKVATGENQLNIGAMTSPLGNSGQYFAFGANPNTNFWQFTGNSTNNGGAIIQGDNQGNLFFITRGTAASNTMNVTQTAQNIKMQIHSNGKVSIGTASTEPDQNVNGGNYLLFVKGGTLSEEVSVRSGWADYVFDNNYTLLPLEQVEQHILQNGHLHNTPSAADLNGTVNLGDATVQQQEKIEEIYLHLIEMNKEIKALKVENQRLKQEIADLK